MRKKNFKGRCEKRHVLKCEDVCRTYDDIQRAYLDKLEANKNIKSIRCNVPMKGPTAERDAVKVSDNVSIVGIVDAAKNGNRSVVDALREHITVEEVAV